MEKIGLLRSSGKTKGGHSRYSFLDMVSIKTIKSLKDAGISTHKIKAIVIKLNEQFPEIRNALAEKSLFVVGNEVTVADKKGAFNPLTGQGTFIENREMKAWVADKTLKSFEIPISYRLEAKLKTKKVG